MHAELESIVIFDSKMYVGNGTVRRWMDGLTLKFGVNARRYAPIQTGELRAGIDTEVRLTAPKFLEGRISSTAPYSLYVIRGTSGPIMSNRLWNAHRAKPDVPLHLLAYNRSKKTGRGGPKRGMVMTFIGKTGVVHALEVRGQASNNFLLEAWNATARTHRSIRPVSIPTNVSHP